MNTSAQCPECRKPVGVNALQGLCPECMMKVGLGSGLSADPDAIPSQLQPFTPPSLDELVPSFPQLELLESLGHGGMGAVYKARQKSLDRLVALKILPPGGNGREAFADRFVREAKAMARLNHPGIVAIFDFGCIRKGVDEPGMAPTPPTENERKETPTGGAASPGNLGSGNLYYFIMEFVDGVNLRALQQAQHLSSREALAIVPQICDALQYAHDQGIVHRDIKPENILIDRQGRVKVADFGLAKLMEGEESMPGGRETASSATLTQEGKVMGTPRYMAPEQVLHPLEVDHRADIYSLGVVFYQMLTGDLPGQRLEPPSLKARVDARLDEVVLRALQKRPEQRYQQASQIKNDVETIASSEVVSSPQAEASSGISPPEEIQAIKRTLQFISGALLLLGILALFQGTLSKAILHSVRSLGLSLFEGRWPELLLSMSGGNDTWLLALVALISAWSIQKCRGLILAHGVILFSVLQQPLLWPLTLPLGIFSLRTLWRRDVRTGFAVVESGSRKPGGVCADAPQGYRLAWISLAIVWLSLFGLPVFLLNPLEAIDRNRFGAVFVRAFQEFIPLAVSTAAVVGWLALEFLRSPRGFAKGTGLALFSALYAPFLMMVGSLMVYPLRWQIEEEWKERLVLNYLWSALAVALFVFIGWINHRSSRMAQADSAEAARSSTPRLFWMARMAVLVMIGILMFPRVPIADLSISDDALMQQFRATHQHHAVLAENEPDPWSVALPAGSLTLWTVSEPAATHMSCWLPDGVIQCPQDLPRSNSAARWKSGRELVFYLDGPIPPEFYLGLHFQCLAMGPKGGQVCPFLLRSGDTGLEALVGVSVDSQVANLALALPAGPWEDTDARWTWAGNARWLKKKAIRRGEQDWEIQPLVVRHSQKYVSVSYLYTSRFDWGGRLVVVDTDGIVYEPDQAPVLQNGVHMTTYSVWPFQRKSQLGKEEVRWQSECAYFHIGMAQLKEVRFQIQPCHKVQFRNVSLLPGCKTSAEAVLSEYRKPDLKETK